MKNLCVLVTRPKPAGETLCNAISKAGGRAIFFPTIEIVPERTAALEQAIDQLDQFDWLIFISPQAVYTNTSNIKARWKTFPAQVKVAAIGEGTAIALREAGLPVDLFPTESWNSEALLVLPDLKTVKDKKIAIFRGMGGREHLADTLIKRGAQITAVISYKRVLPDVDVTEIIKLLRKGKINIIVSSSGESIINLKKLLGAALQNIQALPLVVVSNRMADIAKANGFFRIVMAKNARLDAIMTALNEFGSEGLNMKKTTDTMIESPSPVIVEKPRYFPWSGIGIFLYLLVLIILASGVLCW